MLRKPQVYCRTAVRFYTQIIQSASPGLSNVKGLSNNCVKPASSPVGPGAAHNAEYKVPEYFCFNRYSYAEAEVEMAKYRCPQPSALKK
uniref:Uncharacterized protein n=1 Tax=Glossina palpalis gambiensis TaxID=67801 RepID=A0A1B0AUD2_9MUSC